jgi:hypothetical protein
LYLDEEIGDQFVAEFVTLLNSRPERGRTRIEVDRGRITCALGDELVAGAIGIEAMDDGAHVRVTWRYV